MKTFFARFAPAPSDLLRDPIYRRLWTSILISSFGSQVTLLAIPLSAAVLLHAQPLQMGLLTAAEIVPFALFSLPCGVWLDRVRKLPVYVAGEITLAVSVATVPLAWWSHVLSIRWLYAVAFMIGTVHTIAGSAAQIVLTQIVSRDRLVEAHAKNALASSTAEVTGPSAAGALIKVAGAPAALLATAVLLLSSAAILRGVRVAERPASNEGASFWRALREGIDFVRTNRLLMTMAICVGAWHFCNQCAMGVQILFATRTLGLGERGVGLCYVALGIGTIGASAIGYQIVRRIGPGPALLTGCAITGAGWLLLSIAPAGNVGVGCYAAMLFCFGLGAVFITINFLSLRQSVTPAPMLGRMTTTMRWLILVPAGPGALWGGWLGEHFGLAVPLRFAGLGAFAVTLIAWRLQVISSIRTLPTIDAEGVTPFAKPLDG